MKTEVNRSRIAWFMTSQQPFAKLDRKHAFVHFIEKYHSNIKGLHVNKGFYNIILQKVVDSKLNW